MGSVTKCGRKRRILAISPLLFLHSLIFCCCQTGRSNRAINMFLQQKSSLIIAALVWSALHCTCFNVGRLKVDLVRHKRLLINHAADSEPDQEKVHKLKYSFASTRNICLIYIVMTNETIDYCIDHHDSQPHSHRNILSFKCGLPFHRSIPRWTRLFAICKRRTLQCVPSSFYHSFIRSSQHENCRRCGTSYDW